MLSSIKGHLSLVQIGGDGLLSQEAKQSVEEYTKMLDNSATRINVLVFDRVLEIDL